MHYWEDKKLVRVEPSNWEVHLILVMPLRLLSAMPHNSSQVSLEGKEKWRIQKRVRRITTRSKENRKTHSHYIPHTLIPRPFRPNSASDSEFEGGTGKAISAPHDSHHGRGDRNPWNTKVSVDIQHKLCKQGSRSQQLLERSWNFRTVAMTILIKKPLCSEAYVTHRTCLVSKDPLLLSCITLQVREAYTTVLSLCKIITAALTGEFLKRHVLGLKRYFCIRWDALKF